jgi:pimeloyl-ACP methyl ester carboxylesterase
VKWRSYVKESGLTCDTITMLLHFGKAKVRRNHVNQLLGGPAVQEPSVITQLSMNRRLGQPIFFLLSVLLVWGCWLAKAKAPEQIGPLATGLSKDFGSETATVNGIKLHYVRGGKGPAVILIHGFPQDWFEYHAIMPRLAKQFTVIAIDLRGVGGSTTTTEGYDAANMAQDVHQLARALKLERVYIVGHDLGGQVTYAFVRLYPEATRGAMILDTPIPGIEGWDEIQGHPAMWHARFMQVPGLPEKLVAGRQADYFGYFFHFGKFTPSDEAHFVKAYANPEQLHALFEMYRAFPANAQFNAAQRGRNDVPLFLAAGDGSPFANLVPKIARGLRGNGCTHVESGLIRGAVHYVVEDQPEEVTDLIERYASPHAQ